MLQVVAYLMGNIMNTFAIERYMRVFFAERKTSFATMTLSYMLFFVSSSLLFLFANIPILTVSANILIFSIITLNYKSFMIKRISLALGMASFMMIIELLLFLTYDATITSIFEGVGFESGFVFIYSGVAQYLLALLFQRFRNVRRNHSAKLVYWISTIFIPISSLIVIFVVLILTYTSQSVLAFIIAVILGINLLTFYFQDTISNKAFEDNLKYILDSKEKEYYISQCQLMQESVDIMKSFRHDTKMHLAILKEFVKNDASGDIVGYLNLLLGDIEKSEIYCDTGNLALDSIINYKLRSIGGDDIKINLDVFIPPVLKFEIVDIITIAGNLLDNALDAIKELDDKWVKINMQLSKGTLFIKVENPFNGIVKFKDGDDREIISSKQGDEHGYGLKNIRKSVDKYDGDFKISFYDNIFSVTILLFEG